MNSKEKEIRAAQLHYKRDTEAARRKRQRVFAEAQKDGYSLAAIGELAGIHKSRVSQIINGE